MHIDAIYDQGRLEFQRPVTLKHQRLSVRVEIPDQEILDAQAPSLPTLPPEIVAQARAMRERLDAIRTAPLPPSDQLPALNAKQQQRLDAFALREER
ncbi:MAG: hypothetical protein K9L82_15350 [Chromatiaceae bacterium]|nr:hypothetical protein [Chromatiaceae bacterium]MCF7996331.1 hypothetical protein [Chromatiaceae bacterium]MCF8016848.1 hypothetical protein [Chromatiaceae bacterium]